MNIIEKLSPNGGGPQSPRSGVVHAMGEYIPWGGVVLSAEDFLEKVGLSAHCLVKPNGDRIRTRRPDQVAWHAKGHNSHTYGIEVLVPGEHTYETLIEATKKVGWVSDLQLLALTEEFRWVATQHPDFDTNAIYRHSDLDPKRRWFDPGGGFPWGRFQRQMAGAV